MIWNALPAVLTVVFKRGGAGLRVCNSLCARGVGWHFEDNRICTPSGLELRSLGLGWPRYFHPLDGGYRDLQLTVRISDIVCELQLPGCPKPAGKNCQTDGSLQYLQMAEQEPSCLECGEPPAGTPIYSHAMQSMHL